MRYSVLAIVAVSAAALPAMSRPASAQYAREYDDLMVREAAMEELDRRFLFGAIFHAAKAVVGGVVHAVQNHKNKKKHHNKRHIEDAALYERDLGDEDIFARDLDEENLFARELPEEFVFERELPEDGLYEREYYEYEWY